MSPLWSSRCAWTGRRDHGHGDARIATALVLIAGDVAACAVVGVSTQAILLMTAHVAMTEPSAGDRPHPT